MKLHLGCGGRYLEGYVNVDFPLTHHPVQTRNVADVYADILDLRYRAETIAEVRLHHVFEHFTRPVACALLTCWHAWLQPGGRLHIEVPDFQRGAWRILSPFTGARAKTVALRHLFGSHEAPWAVHCQGYTPRLLSGMLEAFEYRVMAIRKNAWLGTDNFEILAAKNSTPVTREDSRVAARSWMAAALLDGSESEQRLLNTWLTLYDKQVERCWPT